MAATVNLKSLWASKPFRVNLIGGAVLMVIMSFVGAWAFDTNHPLEFDAEKSFVIPRVAKDGDQMLVVWALKRKPRLGCEGEISRKLVDPDTKVLIAAYDAEKTSTGANMCGANLCKTFKLPAEMPKRGWIAYKSDLCYACNPLQKFITAARICYSTPELLFKVQP